MGVREERATARSLRKSLESTLAGLKALLGSLERSGFKEAIEPYRRLQIVLLQQRLWSRTYRRKELDPLWIEIGSTAGEIDRIMRSFHGVMGALKEIENIESLDDTPHSDESTLSENGKEVLPELIVDLLAKQFSFSAIQFANSSDLDDAERKELLRKLTQASILERRGWGRGLSYQLTEEVHNNLVSKLKAS
jgi:hypothetical protein